MCRQSIYHQLTEHLHLSRSIIEHNIKKMGTRFGKSSGSEKSNNIIITINRKHVIHDSYRLDASEMPVK